MTVVTVDEIIEDLTTALTYLEGAELAASEAADCARRLRLHSVRPASAGKVSIVTSTAANHVELAMLARAIGLPSGQPGGCERVARRLRAAIGELVRAGLPRMYQA